MRALIYSAFLVLATLLVAHGIFTEESAKSERDKARLSPSPDYTTVLVQYPYCQTSIEAHLETLDRKVKLANDAALPGKAELKKAVDDILDKTKSGISGKPPFVMPYSAAIIGLAGLLLALIMPGTRMRGLAFLGLLFGGAASLLGMLPTDSQVSLIKQFDFARHVVANFPHVAQGCLLLAGITLAVRARRHESD